MKRTIMKKISFILLSMLLMFTLAACGDKCEHTYDNACDVTCNECGEARAVGAHAFENGKCKSCGEIDLDYEIAYPVTVVGRLKEGAGAVTSYIDETGRGNLAFAWGVNTQIYAELWNENGIVSSGMTSIYAGDAEETFQFSLMGKFDYPPTYVLASNGIGEDLTATMPNVFTQENSQDPEFLSSYMMLQGSGVYGEKLNLDYIHIPFRFSITNNRNETVRVKCVSVQFEDGSIVASSGVALVPTVNGWELTFSGEHTVVTTNLNTDIAPGEKYIAYALVLPIGDADALRDKTIQFVITTEDASFVAFTLRGNQIASANGNDLYDWKSGKSYTINLRTECESCSFGDLNGECSVCGVKCYHTPDNDDGDCTTEITCSVCGVVTTEGKTQHIAHADDGDCTTPITCTECSTVITAAKSHDFSEAWEKDASGHWHVCANEGCAKTDTKADHTSDGAATEEKAEKCTVCEYVITPELEHTHKHNIPKYDTDNHWIECACGDKLAVTAHTANDDDGDCTTAVTCSGCAHIMTAAKDHTPGKDDGNCKTEIKCTVCGKTAVAGVTDHNDANHDFVCDNPGCQIMVGNPPKDENDGINLPIVPN